mgnify:CR=1 FL=1
MTDAFEGRPARGGGYGKSAIRQAGNRAGRSSADHDHERLFDGFAERLAGLIAGTGPRRRRGATQGRPA